MIHRQAFGDFIFQQIRRYVVVVQYLLGKATALRVLED